MYQHRLTRFTALALVVGAVAAPAASARVTDDRVVAPSAPAAGGAPQKQDLRSADARDAAVQAQKPQDLRSPDAIDASAGRGTFTAPDIVVVKVDEPRPQPVADGLDWTDAGIGAGVIAGLSLIALGGALVLTHRRHARVAFH